MFNCLLTGLANWPIAWQPLDAFRCVGVAKTKVNVSTTREWRGMVVGGGLGDCERGMVVVASGAGQSVSQSVDLYWDFLSQTPPGFVGRENIRCVAGYESLY